MVNLTLRTVSVGILISLAPAWAQSAAPELTREGAYWVETVTGYLMAADSGQLQLKMEVSGSVVVRGDGGNQLTYKVRKRVQARNEADARRTLSAWEFSARKMGNVLYITAQPPGRNVVGAELEVHAPRALRQATVETTGGSVQLFDLAAEVQASTGGGPITADRIGGSLRVRTGGGDINMGVIGGTVRAVTGGGPIRLKRSGGDANLETGGGGIVVEESGGKVEASTGAGNVDVARAAGMVFAKTYGGMIRVQEAGGAVVAENAGGAIQVSAARGVRCESAAGGIRLRGVSGELRVVTSVGSILAELLSGRSLADSYISTANGDITVVIPSNLAVTVEALNESPGRSGQIVSDFSEIKMKGGEGRHQNRVMASGALNGGGPVLRIAATQGTIFLRRSK